MFKKKAVGIDVGLDSVKVVELVCLDGGLMLSRIGSARVSDEPIDEEATAIKLDLITKAIKKALTSAKIKTKIVSSSVSGKSVAIRNLRLPKMTPSQLREVIRYEAEDHVPFDMERVILDFEILREVKEHEEHFLEVLVAAAKDEFIWEHIEILKGANLTPKLIDVDIFAIQRAWEYNEGVPRKDAVVALVDIGARSTTLQILEGDIPVFNRDIPIGGNDFTNALVQQLHYSFPEAEQLKERHGKLILPTQADQFDERSAKISYALESVATRLSSELDRSFAYYYTQLPIYRKNVEQIVLSGGGAQLRGLGEVLSSSLGINIRVIEPFKRIRIPGIFDVKLIERMGSIFAVSIGLGIRSLLS